MQLLNNKDSRDNQFAFFSRSAGGVSFIVGCVVLIGWLFDLEIFKSVLPGLVTMKANTAFCFVLLGISLWLSVPEQSGPIIRLVPKFFALVVALIAALTLSEYTFGRDFGIDQLLFEETAEAVGTSHSGRMAPNTALNFVMVSLALFLKNMKGKHVYHLIQFLSLGTAIVGLLGIIGYGFGIQALYGIGFYTQMALHTAIIFIWLGLGVLFASPYQGLMTAVTSENTGSFMLRRVLPVAVATPVILGWLRLEGERSGLYSTEVGVALFVIVQVIVLSAVIWANAVLQNRTDNERKRAEEELKRYRESLEELVEERTSELKRMNRGLRMLSECNQALVHITDEQTLQKEICKIIVTVGGYRLAWVGYAEHDAQKTVRPVAYAGYDEGFLERLRVTWADTEYGRGPSGTAIRTLRPAVFHDISSNPALAPWCENAIKHGYQSVIGLPLLINSDSIGVLTICAGEPEAFHDDEIRLLTELANDLSYGISALRIRVEHRQAEEEIRTLNEELEQRVIERTAQLKAANETLQSYADEISDLYNNAPCGYHSLDENGLFVNINETELKWLGYTRDEIVGKKRFSELITLESLEVFKQNYPVFKEQGWISNLEFAMIRKDGSIIPVLLNATAAKDASGRFEKSRSTLFDITERKKAEKALQGALDDLNERTRELENTNIELNTLNRELELRRNEAEMAKLQAEAATRAKSDFLANMSHELRTPLNSIIGFSEILQDEMYGDLNAQQKEYVTAVLASAKHLLNLINDILDLSKVESGKMELELSSFSLRDVLDMSQVMFKEKALKHNIKLGLEIQPDADREIEADERKLKQILFNLIGNAVKFTPDGGWVNINARRIVNRGIDFIELSVEDTGIGIKAEEMDKLFNEFTQLETAYEKKYQGTGLGLALTKKLVELHGGRIWAESEFGKGSRFSFVIPVRQKR